MNKTILTVCSALIIFSGTAMAQNETEAVKEKEEGFTFTTIKELPITSIKNQASSGTCWCFSAMSFLESEILRNGCSDKDLDLSEMFVVSHAYGDKADKYVRLDGVLNFAQGSSTGDVLTTIGEYGIVPDTVMNGLNYGTTRHQFGELDAAMKGYLDAIVKNPNRKLSTAWRRGFQGILDAYFGAYPETFEYQGKEYTPKTYFESLGINLDDYVSLTSYTHHPFYTQFAVEVEDNWRWELSYNVPIDELMEIMYNSVEKGYTFVWASDVSEKGFTRDGIAIMPDMDALEKEAVGSDQAHWLGLSSQAKSAELAKMLEKPCPEIVATQEMRQEAFDNKETTDDHGMHAYGIAEDQNGKKYFMIKNSWGITGKYKGIWYASDSFVRYKTMDILVHKDAIPKDIKKKLGIK